MAFQELVLQERIAQDSKWGGPPCDDQHVPSEWCAIMVRHMGLGMNDGDNCWDEERYLRRLVRVASLCQAAYESRLRLAGKVAGPPFESRGKGF